ncbi:MAG: alcohol dehydrogenase, partial [Alicyclobacillus sp.]|nr:alcohol dehydrogenase [Alicyclobacillus sp.]
MPRQLVAVAPREAALLTYDDDVELQPGQVRVQVEYASPKHGSELLAFRGESPHQQEYYDAEWQLFLPRENDTGVAFGDWNLGNQWIGRVIEVGPGVSEVAVGDRLCGYGGIRETQVVTLGRDRRLRRVGPGVKWKNALCFDPAQFALGAVRDSGLR